MIRDSWLLLGTLVAAVIGWPIMSLPFQVMTPHDQTSTVVDSADLRGTVIDGATGRPLSYAIVSIPALNIERFANERGQFVFPKLPVATYRLRVRQLGYTPTTIDATLSRTSAGVSIKLTRIAYRLAGVNVSSDWKCDQPGRPTSNAQASEVFEQLEQNADRLRLLFEQYPFIQRGQRDQFLLRSDGEQRNLQIDTTVMDGGKHVQYRPGEMVTSTRESRAVGDYFFQVPTLLDFADSTFQRNHCFVLRGIEKDDTLRRIRVDFKAWEKIRKADVEGSVFLDSATYQLRDTELRMTRIPNEIKGLKAFRVTTHFREVHPGLPVIGKVRTESDLLPVRSNPGVIKSVEEQTPIELFFLKQKPDSVPR